MRKYKLFASAITLISAYCGTVQAEKELLNCRLMSKEMSASEVTIQGDNGSIAAFRDSGICVFDDGRVAEKNFVVANLAASDFSEGSYSGFSVYTFESGDSILLGFTGGWGADGNRGNYTIVSGTGAYKGVSGDGHFIGLDSPWDGTNWFEVTIRAVVP